MTKKKFICSFVLLTTLASGWLMFGQAPVVNIGRNRHENLWNPHQNIVAAYQYIESAQQSNNYELGGHAQKAKDLLTQADEELKLAAKSANHR